MFGIPLQYKDWNVWYKMFLKLGPDKNVFKNEYIYLKVKNSLAWYQIY